MPDPDPKQLKAVAAAAKKANASLKAAQSAMSEIEKLAASAKDEQKLRQMIEKRRQMFDTLRQVIDRYDDTAQQVVRSIGR